MRDQMNGITAFVSAAESSSFAIAAQKMGLSRSAVGKAVAKLEDNLGVQLFVRTTRSLSLTEEGMLFYESCSNALGEIDKAKQSFDTGQREPVGRISISVPVLLGRHCVTPVLLELAQKYPKLEIDVNFTDRPIDLIESGYDLAIRSGPLNNEGHLKARRLGSQIMILCASLSYLQKHGTPLRIEEIEKHDAIIYSKGASVISWSFTKKESTYDIHPSGRIRFNDLEAIVDATTKGVGIALLPSWLIANQLHSRQLIELLPEFQGLSCEVNAIWPLGRYLPMRTRVVIDELAVKIPQMLYHGI